MKTLSFTLISLLVACQVMAGDMKEIVKFGAFANITTNAVTTTNSPDGNKFYYGDFEGLYIDFTATTGTVTIALTTAGDTGTGPSRTLFSAAVTAGTDVWIPVRSLAKTEANATTTYVYVPLPVFQDKLQLKYSSVNVTNIGFTAWAYIR